MKRWLSLLLLTGWAAAADVVPVPWPNPSVAWGNTNWPGDFDTHGQPNLRPGRWNDVDLTAYAPAGATHVQLHGILVISRGHDTAPCSMMVWFRPRGMDGTAGAYMGQTVAVGPGNGARTPHTILVPVVWQSGKAWAQLWYDVVPAPAQQWPDYCAFGFTYRPQFFLR